jgi:hypothetical protein
MHVFEILERRPVEFFSGERVQGWTKTTNEKKNAGRVI